MKHAVTLGLALMATWLLWSGHYTALLVGLGVASVVTVVAVLHRMGLVDRESVPLHITARTALYAPWLAREIVKANLDVVRRVLDPRLPVQPQVFHTVASQRTELGRVVYANSITLTPGTVSIDVGSNQITVHALSREAAEGVQSREMDRRVRNVEARS